MKKTNWWLVGIIIILLLLLLFGGGMLFGGWGYHGYGMMRGYGGYVGPGGMMMGWGYSPFGWIGMLFMWFIPIGLIALVVFGIAALVHNSGNGPQPPALQPCPNCGKGTQADWQNCPYCGTTLK